MKLFNLIYLVKIVVTNVLWTGGLILVANNIYV